MFIISLYSKARLWYCLAAINYRQSSLVRGKLIKLEVRNKDKLPDHLPDQRWLLSATCLGPRTTYTVLQKDMAYRSTFLFATGLFYSFLFFLQSFNFHYWCSLFSHLFPQSHLICNRCLCVPVYKYSTETE